MFDPAAVVVVVVTVVFIVAFMTIVTLLIDCPSKHLMHLWQTNSTFSRMLSFLLFAIFIFTFISNIISCSVKHKFWCDRRYRWDIVHVVGVFNTHSMKFIYIKFDGGRINLYYVYYIYNAACYVCICLLVMKCVKQMCRLMTHTFTMHTSTHDVRISS